MAHTNLRTLPPLPPPPLARSPTWQVPVDEALARTLACFAHLHASAKQV